MSDEFVSLLAGIAARTTVVLLVALLVARLAVRRSAALRHAVYATAIVGVIVIPALATLGPGIRAPFLTDAVTSGLQWLKRPIRSLRGEPGGGLVMQPGRDLSLADGISVATSHESRPVSRGLLALAILWGAGVLIVGGRTAVRAMRATRLTSRARRVRDPAILAAAATIARRQGQVVPPILETVEVSTPATAGILRPVVVLPLVRAWTDEHLRTVLAHELGHVARRDCLTQHLAQAACALHWFNPLVWVVERRMALERERACDDIAVKHSASPDGYATLLLDFARRTSPDAGTPAAMLAMARPSELETRLIAILDPARDRGAMSRRGRRTLGGIAAVIVALAGGVDLDAAPVAPNGPVAQQGRGEPDTRNDSVAGPGSERITQVSLELARRRGRIVLSGPDSSLARVLLVSLQRDPRGPEDLVRERAAWALSQAQGTQLVEPLIAALEHNDWRVRAYAAWSLAPARDPRAVPGLIQQMSHPVWRMRAMAAHALAEMSDVRARPAMAAAATDEAWQVRVNGVRYLARFDDADARARLRVARRDSHVMVRQAAERARTP